MDNEVAKPIISIVIPTCNRAHLVGRAIESVLKQTFKEYELIIVDDCSEDNTEEIVKGFNDSRIKYIKHENNKGGSATRNTGIRIARGEYIGLLDDDDEWLPEKLEKQINKFKTLSEKVGIVYCMYVTVICTEKSEKLKYEGNSKICGNVLGEMLKRVFVGSPTPLIRKECFDKAGYFDETLPSCQDWDMWIRIAKYYDYDFVPEVLAKFYFHNNQISANYRTKIFGMEKVLEKHKENFLDYPKSYAHNLNKLGILNSYMGNIRKSQKYLLKTLKISPLFLFQCNTIKAILRAVCFIIIKSIRKVRISEGGK